MCSILGAERTIITQFLLLLQIALCLSKWVYVLDFILEQQLMKWERSPRLWTNPIVSNKERNPLDKRDCIICTLMMLFVVHSYLMLFIKTMILFFLNLSLQSAPTEYFGWTSKNVSHTEYCNFIPSNARSKCSLSFTTGGLPLKLSTVALVFILNLDKVLLKKPFPTMNG